MNKNTLSVLILISGILISGAIIGSADAQTQPLLQPQEQKMPGDVQYPIPELGNCKNKSACKIFCDDSKNSDACLAFAEQHNLMSSEETTAAKKFIDNGMVGPGNCKGQAECDQYCGNSEHMEECITFAQKNGMMPQNQLEESQKVLAAIKRGVKPPACGGPKECDKYCSSSAHMEECINFSIEAGIMDKGKQEEAQKVLAAIKRGIKPPACNGPQECDAYCSAPEHMEECINFSIETGMMPKQEQEQAQKMLSAIKQGIKPPACQPNPPGQSGQPNQSEQPSQQNQNQPNQANQSSQPGQGLQKCEQYCADPNHVEECVKFSVAMGNMTEQQAQNSIKNGNKGPGGCVGREACDTFCNNPDNQETCFNFGKDNGMIPQEDLQKMQDGQQRMKDSFSQIPQEVLDCLTSSLGADVVEKMKNGSMIPQKAGDSINQCFQKAPQGKMPNQNQQGQPNQQIQPWADMCSNNTELACVDGAGEFVASAKVGSDKKPVCPAGSTAKCGNYQQQNQQGQPGDKFQPGSGTVNPGGQQMPQQAGPGGCKGPEECKAYCESHQDECKNFQPQQNQSQPGQNQPTINQGQPGQLFREKLEPIIQGQPGEPGQFIQGEPGQYQPNQPNQQTPGQFFQGQLEQFIQGQQLNQPGQFIQGEPGQIQPQQQIQPQFQPQPLEQQQNPPPPSSPSGFLQGTQRLLANILDAFR